MTEGQVELIREISAKTRELESTGLHVECKVWADGSMMFFNGVCFEWMNGNPVIAGETTI